MGFPAAFSGRPRVPPPTNDPIRSYEPGSAERASIKSRLAALASDKVDIPLVIGGKEIRTGNTAPVVMPHDHHHVLGIYHKATAEHVQQAIEAAVAAQIEWSRWPYDERAARTGTTPQPGVPVIGDRRKLPGWLLGVGGVGLDGMGVVGSGFTDPGVVVTGLTTGSVGAGPKVGATD